MGGIKKPDINRVLNYKICCPETVLHKKQFCERSRESLNYIEINIFPTTVLSYSFVVHFSL